MCRIVILGGTTEGRVLAQYLDKKGTDAVICVASQYGEDVLPHLSTVRCLTGRMEQREMEQLLTAEQAQVAVDATHPYAKQVTENLKRACETSGVTYLRCVREGETENGSQEVAVGSVSEAVDFLRGTTGAVLVTTGSKELAAFTALPQFESRIFARVLPDSKVVSACENMGIRGKQLICMQGPFSEETNAAMLHQLKIDYLVTKEAGAAGGYREKREAARRCGATLVVIGRPGKEEGYSLPEIIRYLDRLTGNGGDKSLVTLVGMGPGNPRCMTLEAVRAIQKAQAVLGAPRLLEAAAEYLYGKETAPLYLADQVAEWLGHHPQYGCVAVLSSGDTGFYSNAGAIAFRLKREGYDCVTLPGLSSVSYLAAAMGIPWERVFLASAHGRELDVAKVVREHREVFLLLGGTNGPKAVMDRLCEAGLSDVSVTVGEYLSYSEERILTGNVGEMAGRDLAPLSVAYFRR